ncbi:MAG: hypothetical protein A2782_04410 [Candidatus Blackburnbacteria bacterium RIFCSPHIGHO2_01_FULL_43_15b]|uniref:DUF5678 domain-containing protein n=1 Tax=Candidatus Blackburnbacteria bacterium RIFCSPHIGHO2_01_FULL_43_15b TaxID=1797513 RepID=A0A1G1V3I3_9BACT|nr:MAG: hypothetical protein A2782_04410 [Candidatus Blackburnbacteria bacterium RIFCSPHIGHO2_01_FULL_43_15b]
MVNVNIDKWIREREKKDKVLYEKYGRSLEKKHKGKLAAIGSSGKVILGDSDLDVVEKAIKEFGNGNFGFFKIGYTYTGKWLKATK